MTEYTEEDRCPDQNILFEKIQEIFNKDPEKHGRPNTPTQEGFIALAQLGKHAWNAWRKNYPMPCPNFEGVDFREKKIEFSQFLFANVPNLPCVNFDGAIFGDRIDFSSAVFGRNASFINATFGNGASFSEAEFGDHACFLSAKFGDMAKFNNSSFGHLCSFNDSIFGELADFQSSEFGDSANFSRAIFEEEAKFINSNFSNSASFTNAKFGNIAKFEKANFGNSCDFMDCNFGDSAHFNGATFGNLVCFSEAIFGTFCRFENTMYGESAEFTRTKFSGHTIFNGSKFGAWATFEGAEFFGQTDYEQCEFKGDVNFSADINNDAPPNSKKFHITSYAGTKFHGDVDFTGRQFQSITNFGPKTLAPFSRNNLNPTESPSFSPVIFCGVPNFHECQFNQNTNFDRAEFIAVPSPKAVRAYRTLKGAMSELNATREEQIFFRLEIQAEYPSHSIGRRILYTLYSLTSFYGISITRPIITIIVVSIGIGALHGLLANSLSGAYFPASLDGIDSIRTWQWLRYVLIDMIPVPGLDKTQIELRDALFGKDGGIVTAAMALEMLHKLIALGCVFLLGLALRNLFKMKS